MITLKPKPLLRVRRRSLNAGFTIMEVALALIIFTMMTLMFAAVFPVAVRSAQFSNNYSQAALVAQHKLDQMRSAGYTRVVSSSALISLNVIDAVNANGSYDFTTADNLASTGTTQGFFLPGSTGTLTVTDDTANSIPSGSIAYVTVRIAWTTINGTPSTYTTSAMIAKASP